MSKILSKILRSAITNNEYIIGAKEITKGIDKVKLLIGADTLDSAVRSRFESLCKEKGITFYNTKSTSRELGRLCNKQFRVSLIAITNIDDNDLAELVKEINTN
jgi:ribosomal protein L30E